MQDLLLKAAMGLILKLVSEKFLAKAVVYTLRAWSKTTQTEWDDKVTEAMAEALGVEAEVLKSLPKAG